MSFTCQSNHSLNKILFNTAKNMKLELDIQSPQNSSVSYDSANSNGFDHASEDIKKMLRAGIKFAKEGSRTEARQMLLQVTEADGNNETAWLWLASISEYPEELLVFLQNVLRINPDNERAIEWAKQTKSLLSKTFVQRGIDASHQNQKDFAKQCFLQAIVHDDQSEMAWLWLASSTDSPEEKCSHLQKVLNINPDNETAFSSLKAVKSQISQALLKKANSAAIAGDHEHARQMLAEILKNTPNLEDAWVLKAFLTNDYYEKIACYEKALETNPNHDAAQAGLAALKALAPKTPEPKPEPVAVQEVTEPEAVAEASPQELTEETEPEQFVEPVEEVEQSVEAVTESVTETDEAAEVTQLAEENQSAESQEQSLEDFYTESEDIETVAESTAEVQTAEENRFEAEAEFWKQVEAEADSNEVEAADESFETESDSPVTEENQIVEEDSVEAAEMQVAETEQAQENQVVEEFEEVREPVQFEESQAVEEFEDTQESQVAEFSTEVIQAEANEVSYEAENEAPATVEETFSPSPSLEHGFAMLSNNEPFADYQQPTVELTYTNLPEEAQTPFEEKTAEYAFNTETQTLEENQPRPEVALQAEDFSSQDEASTELQTIESQQVSELPEVVEESAEPLQAEISTQVFNLSQIQAESFKCAFCEFENQPQAVICESCQAMLSLSDLEMLLAHQNANQDVVLRAIERMEVEKTLRDLSLDELQNLGIAHLNVHNLRKGFSYLQEASQMNPNDVVLASKVNFLAIRLSEIEEQDQKAQENPVQSRTILVVDDSPTVRKLISGKLEKSGHSVVSAVDGMDALAKINEVIPDLILLDITMPRLDGYQVCKLIRNNDLTKDIPIVMISGKDGFFDKVRGRMAGSSGYITKPFGPDTLMKTIETYLN
jgi:CheY-like chemotaxis protein